MGKFMESCVAFAISNGGCYRISSITKEMSVEFLAYGIILTNATGYSDWRFEITTNIEEDTLA